MKYPKIKNALLCRILTYLVPLSVMVLPAIVLPLFLPEIAVFFIWMAIMVCVLIWIIKNFMLLMTLDALLAVLHCYNTAGKRFIIQRNNTKDKILKRISLMGRKYDPAPNRPCPASVRYKLSHPMTIYSSGIEKIILTYHTDNLDKACYNDIVKSAEGNVRALSGTKKARFLDKAQKNSPLNRVTVVFIFAKSVDEALRTDLYDTVCKRAGDDWEISFLPCVIDEETGYCVFNSVRMPYVGYAYPVKNRGVRIIRNCVFGGMLPKAECDDSLMLSDWPEGVTYKDASLWDLIKYFHYEFVGKEKENKKRFSAMQNGEVILDGEYVFAMWEDRGVCLLAQTDEEKKHITVERIHKWSYPKEHIISKAARIELKVLIEDYFEGIGYSSEFEYFEG